MATDEFRSDALYALFSEPASRVWIVWFRLIVFGVMVYRLLSRDFSHFAVADGEILQMYPYLFQDEFLGRPWVVDIFTFHWLHWIFPFPDANQLQVIQLATVVLCLFVILFGKGRYAWLALSSYIGIAYLGGYIWRTGTSMDGSFVPMMLILVYISARFDEPRLIWGRRQKYLLNQDIQAGHLFSLVLIVFISYYFMAGLNKITNLSVSEWFHFDIYNTYHYYFNLMKYANYTQYVPEFFRYLVFHPYVNYFVPIIYISHLLIPFMFFYRNLIYHFMCFYLLFHFFSTAINVLFFELMVAWLVMLPIGDWLRRFYTCDTKVYT